MKNLHWDDLKILLAVGRQGSLTAAAQLLGIDQSTAGRRLSALEADLGVVLFVRSKRGFAPTGAGEAAIRHAVTIENQTEKLRDDLTKPAQGAAGTVRLIGNAWTLDRILQHSGASFLENNPDLNLRIVTLMPQRPVRGEATLSLWFERKKREDEFSIELGKVPYAVYRHKNMSASNKRWVEFFDEDFERPKIAKAMENIRDFTAQVRLTATDASQLYTAISAGMGRGFLPVCLAHKNKSLIRDMPEMPIFSRALALHLHPDNLETKRMRAAINWIRDGFSAAFMALP